jgi:hypothetical protein
MALASCRRYQDVHEVYTKLLVRAIPESPPNEATYRLHHIMKAFLGLDTVTFPAGFLRLLLQTLRRVLTAPTNYTNHHLMALMEQLCQTVKVRIFNSFFVLLHTLYHLLISAPRAG